MIRFFCTPKEPFKKKKNYQEKTNFFFNFLNSCCVLSYVRPNKNLSFQFGFMNNKFFSYVNVSILLLISGGRRYLTTRLVKQESLYFTTIQGDCIYSIKQMTIVTIQRTFICRSNFCPDRNSNPPRWGPSVSKQRS